MLELRTILVPTDFSEPARCAFDLACALARDYGARLLVVHVEELIVLAGELGVPLGWPEEADQALLERLRTWRPDGPEVAVEHRLLRGHPAEQILDLARSTPCDLIVLGTHGRTGLSRLLAGSVAEAILRRARCPVLTVRSPRTEPIASTATSPASVPGPPVGV